MKELFKATATAIGGGSGRVESENLKLKLRTPVELGGPGGEGTDPEELFAAGYAACFGAALQLAAKLKKVEIGEIRIQVENTFSRLDDGHFQFAARIEAVVPGVSQKTAEALVADAVDICPFGRALRENILVGLVVKAE